MFFLEKICESPPLVSHSEIIQPDRTTNETIQYICQDGYQLNGPGILKCVLSQWQPTPPICEREICCYWFFFVELKKENLAIRCEDPQTRFNGFIESLSNVYPVDSMVTFHCPLNLTLRGSRISKCQINGSWLPKIPKCQGKYYFHISSISHFI